MNNFYKISFLAALILTIGTFVFAQTDEDTGECSPYIEETMKSINQCGGLGSNQACYGKNNIEALDTSGDLISTFISEGDTVDLQTVESLNLAEMDELNDVWGISLLNILTNTPITGSAREVNLVLFGGVKLDNSVETNTAIDGFINASGTVILRTGPATANGALAFLAPNTELKLVGRLASSAWLRVQVVETEKVGWVQANLVKATDETGEPADLDELTVMSPSAPYYSSMQAFTYESSTNTIGCSDMPTNGLLMQTPEGSAQVTMSMNGVSINLQGTAFAQAEKDGEMTISMLEGNGTISSGGQTVPIYAGTQVTVNLDGLTSIGAPSDPEPMDDNLQDLPGEITGDIVVSEPLDGDVIAALLEPEGEDGNTTTVDNGGDTGTTTTTGDGGGETDGQANCQVKSDGKCGPKGQGGGQGQGGGKKN